MGKCIHFMRDGRCGCSIVPKCDNYVRLGGLCKSKGEYKEPVDKNAEKSKIMKGR